MRSGGHDCHYHAVDTEATLAFVLDVLKQRVQMCGGRTALRQQLLERATGDEHPQGQTLNNELELSERHLAGLEVELKTIGRNLARATDDAIFAVVQGEYRDKQAEVERARHQVERLRNEAVETPALTPEEEVDAALQLFDEIERVAIDPAARAEIPQLLGKLNLNLGLRFAETTKGDRTTRVVQSGIMTMGPHPRSLLQGSGDPRRMCGVAPATRCRRRWMDSHPPPLVLRAIRGTAVSQLVNTASRERQRLEAGGCGTPRSTLEMRAAMDQEQLARASSGMGTRADAFSPTARHLVPGRDRNTARLL